MTYVFYDVETTGLKKRFDQIVSFAAIRTDNELNIVDQFETRARVLPHILPSPGAIVVTGTTLDLLFDPGLPTHFNAVTAIHAKLTEWSPALFLGFNSIDFDEEMLRQAFYQSLKPAFLTSTSGNARADVLSLCRVTAALRPDVIVPAIEPSGRPVFRLAELAAANGLGPVGAHSAMIDAATTLSLCRHIRQLAPELWSQFQRFANKASVESFIEAEEAFVFFDARAGGEGPFLLTPLGRYASNPARVHCLNPLADLDGLAAMDEAALEAVLNTWGQTPLTGLRVNAAPMMTEVFQAAREHCGGLDEGEVLTRVARIRDNPLLGARILDTARRTERKYPVSGQVEDQLYGYAFPGQRDDERMKEFHTTSSWQRRAELTRLFEDMRLRRISQRIVYFSGERALPADEEDRLKAAVRARVLDKSDVPWRTIHSARVELDDLQGTMSLPDVDQYRAYLDRVKIDIGSHT